MCLLAMEKTVLLTDETSKFGNKFMGYEACDSEGNFWVLGLRDIESLQMILSRFSIKF